MTIANTFASKLVVGFVAVAMFLSLSFAPVANAQSSEDLQAQITALLAQITSLQGNLGGSSSAACTFTRALTMGASGADVTCLQNYLIAAGHAIPAGATGYFGAQTQAAVSAWQAANGVSPAAGYFGPLSQAKYSMLVSVSGGSDDDDANDDANDDDDSLSGEASLDEFNINDGDETSLEEGQEDAPVAEFEVEFTDGDARITRIDVSLVGDVANDGDNDPWEVFEEVSLWVDGDEVARMAADDEDEYLDEDDGSLRFSGLDIVGMEDEAVTIEVAVSVQGSIDGVANGEDWTIDADAIRFIDADDVSTTEEDPSTDAGVDFDIDAEGSDDEVIVKTSSEDPEATTITVDEDEKSDWTTIFAFDLDTDDSVNDIEVNELVVNLFSADDEIADMLSDAQLVIDGETYDDYTLASMVGGSASTTFDIDGDLVIDAGDRVTAEFQVEFKQITGNYAEGDTITASTTGASGDFEGADDVDGTGSANGETHTLRTQGVVLEANSFSETLKENSDATDTDDEGVFVIKFDVTAFESDIFVNKSAASGTTMGTNGANFLVTNGSGTAVGTTTAVASLSSTADTDGTRFKIAEGETETFTLTVNYDPGISGFYGVQLYSLNFKDTNGDPSMQQRALPASNYETDPLSI